MKLDFTAIESELARQCLTASDAATRGGISAASWSRVMRLAKTGADVKPFLAGKVAKGLGVDPEAITEVAA